MYTDRTNLLADSGEDNVETLRHRYGLAFTLARWLRSNQSTKIAAWNAALSSGSARSVLDCARDYRDPQHPPVFLP